MGEINGRDLTRPDELEMQMNELFYLQTHIQSSRTMFLFE